MTYWLYRLAKLLWCLLGPWHRWGPWKKTWRFVDRTCERCGYTTSEFLGM